MIRVRLKGVNAGREFDPDVASVNTMETLTTLRQLQEDFRAGRRIDGFDEMFLLELSKIDFDSVKMSFERTASDHIILVLI